MPLNELVNIVNFTGSFNKMEKIHGPAFRSPSGDIYADPIPASHFSLSQNIKGLLGGDVKPLKWASGFLTTSGRYVERDEAKKIALQAGQIVNPISGSEDLFSEELWIP